MRIQLAVACAIGLAISLPGGVAALPTDIVGNSPLLRMSDADKKLFRDAVLNVLESSDVRAVREWKNDATGFSGRVEGRAAMQSVDGLSCRRLQLRAQGQGTQSQFTFPFCKDQAGEWFIASGKKFNDEAQPP
ncbi:RT0821/Lpp0805 family surface protein [Steroidobacter cummioxidans]|uniref:RT0821/Lpp0805 family surface protein n=1 Tax=Steroidobacter cummioxidans TaxID=1803913 RepID=UPI000E317C89|nr:RT0821/Lpp0805 family surface protein [Steroidobacter cummioxidans]